MKSIILTSLSFLIMNCQTQNTLEQEVKIECKKWSEEFVQKSIHIIQTDLDYKFPESKIKNEQIVKDYFTSKFYNNFDETVDSIINSLSLSKVELNILLDCLKSNNPSSKICTESASVLKQLTNLILDKFPNYYDEMINYIISKSEILTIDIDESQCKKLRTGEFYSINLFEDDTIKIFRTKDKQIMINGNDTSNFLVEWNPNCTYKLSPDNQPNDTIITYKITNKINSGYRFIYSVDVNKRTVFTDIGIVE